MGAAASSDRAIVLNPCMPPFAARSPAFCCPPAPPFCPPANFCFPRAPIFTPPPPIPPQAPVAPLCCSPTQPILPTRPAPILPSTPFNGCNVGASSFLPNLQQQLCGLAAGLAMVGPHANPVGCGLPTQPPPIPFQGALSSGGPCLPFPNGQPDYPINQPGFQVNSIGSAPFSSDSFGPVQGQGLGPCQPIGGQSFDVSQPILPYPTGSNNNPPLAGNQYIGQNNFVNSSIFPQASSTPIACNGTPYSGFSNGSFAAPPAQTLPPLNQSQTYAPQTFGSHSFGGASLPQAQSFATQSIPNVGLGTSQSFGPSFNVQGLGVASAGTPPPPQISSALSSANLCGPQGFSTSQSFGSPLLGSQSFGNPALATQSFGSPALGGQSYGSPTLATQSFGNPAALGGQNFGSSPLATQSFGSAALGGQSLGPAPLGSQSFGAATTLGGSNFGSSPLATQSFGANGCSSGFGVQSQFATGSFDSNGLAGATSQPFYGGQQQYQGAAPNLASINQPLQNLTSNFNNLNLSGSLPINNFGQNGAVLPNLHPQPVQVQNSMSYQLPTTVTQAPQQLQQQGQYPAGSYQQTAAQLASAQQYAAHHAAQQAALHASQQQPTTFVTSAVAGLSQPGVNQQGAISTHPDFQIQVNKVQRVREYCIPLNTHVRPRPGPQQQQQFIVSPSQYSRHYARHQIINCTQIPSHSQRKGYVQTIVKNSTLNSFNPCKQYTDDLSKKQCLSTSEDDCQPCTPCPPCPPCPTSSQSIKC